MYRIVMVHQGEDQWAADVQREVRAAARSAGLPADRLLFVEDAPDDVGDPAAVVYLASAAGARDAGAKLQRLAAAGYPVVPLHRPDEADVRAAMPLPLERLNAMNWGDRRRAALVVLQAVGLGEEDRRLFLSYRRTDSGTLSLQLHTALVQRGFDVFLDRFSVDVGADFQRQIHVDLADKAFVLFIESTSARNSQWVEEEVAYAMRHHISHLALTLPDVPPDRRFPTVDDAFRRELEVADFVPGTEADPLLTSAALERVLDEVETRYAGLVRRRREQLLGSLTQALVGKGYQVVPAADWAVVAQPTSSEAGEARIYLTTVRAPTPRDLHQLHGLREPLIRDPDNGEMVGIVVHPAADVNTAAEEIVTWIGDGRLLSTMLLDEAVRG